MHLAPRRPVPTERGLRAGVVLVGVLLLASNLRAGITAVGPVIGDIRADTGISGAAASLLISLPLLGFAAISPVAPAVARRLGLEWSLAGSLALLALAIVARSVPVWGALWVGTALLGVAIAMINVLLPALIKREYPGRVGPMTGIYSAVQSGVAAVAAGLAVPIAGLAPAGWRLSLGVWAGLAVIGLGAFAPMLRRRSADVSPRDAVGAVPAASTPHPVATLSIPSMWTSPLAWAVTLFLGLQSTVYYVVITWWPALEASEGVAPATAGWHQFVFQTLGIVGSLAAAALMHRLRSQSGMVVFFGMLGVVAVVGQMFAPHLGVVWMVLLGLFGGSAITIGLSLFGLRTRNHRAAAAMSGMAQSVGYLLAAAGPIAIGMLHDATGGWTAPLIVLLAVLVGVIVFGVVAGRQRFVGETAGRAGR